MSALAQRSTGAFVISKRHDYSDARRASLGAAFVGFDAANDGNIDGAGGCIQFRRGHNYLPVSARGSDPSVARE